MQVRVPPPVTVEDVRRYGAIGNDSTDNYAALLRAANACRGTDKVFYVPFGTFRCGQALDLTRIRHIDCRGILKFTASNGVTIGTESNANLDMLNGRIHLQLLGPGSGSFVGCTVRGMAHCDVGGRIASFDTSLLLAPQSSPGTQYIAYCTFTRLRCELAGTYAVHVNAGTYVNENLFANLVASSAPTGLYVQAGGFNNNVFLKPTFEVCTTPIRMSVGTQNQFIAPRLELAGSVTFDGTAADNVVDVLYPPASGLVPLAGNQRYANIARLSSIGSQWCKLFEVTYRDWLHRTDTADQHYFCPKLISTASGGAGFGQTYFANASVDESAQTFTIGGTDRGYVDVPVVQNDVLFIDIETDSTGSPIGTLLMLDASKATLATLSGGDQPYIATPFVNASGHSGVNAFFDFSKTNINLTRIVQVNRSDVAFLRIQARAGKAYKRFAVYKLESGANQGTSSAAESPVPNDLKIIASTATAGDRYGQIAQVVNGNNLWFNRGGAWEPISNRIQAITTKTATYAATVNDYTILCDATSGAMDVDMPAAASHSGGVYVIMKIDASGNAVSIDPNSTELINGSSTSVALSSQWDKRIIQSNGTAWYVIGN